jgi:hypothetical protein
LGRSSRGPVSESLLREGDKGRKGQQGIYRGKSACRRRQRKGGNGQLSLPGPFYLAPVCFEAISYAAQPVILATWEAEIRRIMVQGHLRQKVRPCLKNTQYKKELVGWLKW